MSIIPILQRVKLIHKKDEFLPVVSQSMDVNPAGLPQGPPFCPALQTRYYGSIDYSRTGRRQRSNSQVKFKVAVKVVDKKKNLT